MRISDSDLKRAYTYGDWKGKYPIVNRYIRLYAVDHRGMRKSFRYDTQFHWHEFIHYYLEDNKDISIKDRRDILNGDLSSLVVLEEKRTKNFQQLYTAIDAKVEDRVDFKAFVIAKECDTFKKVEQITPKRCMLDREPLLCTEWQNSKSGCIGCKHNLLK
jgi:NhaP-type Na+/H+ and K+/H+ antiporter